VLNQNTAVRSQSSTGGSHIRFNSQNFIYAPPDGALTPEGANREIGLIDLMISVTSSPNGLRMLQQTRIRLEQSLTKAVPSGLPGN